MGRYYMIYVSSIGTHFRYIAYDQHSMSPCLLSVSVFRLCFMFLICTWPYWVSSFVTTVRRTEVHFERTYPDFNHRYCSWSYIETWTPVVSAKFLQKPPSAKNFKSLMGLDFNNEDFRYSFRPNKQKFRYVMSYVKEQLTRRSWPIFHIVRVPYSIFRACVRETSFNKVNSTCPIQVRVRVRDVCLGDLFSHAHVAKTSRLGKMSSQTWNFFTEDTTEKLKWCRKTSLCCIYLI